MTVALPFLIRKEGKKVLIGDNLSSHFSTSVLTECEKNNITFVCLPPNSTHLCQPLDVAFFRPLKMKWRQILTAWKSGGGRRTATISKDKFPELLNALLDSLKETQSDNLISGFRTTGLWPLNKEEVLRKLPHSDNDDNGDNPNESVSDAFVTYLKDVRYGDQGEPANKRVRRKMVGIEPGKSIGSVNINSKDEPTAGASTQAPSAVKTAVKKPTRHLPSSSSSSASSSSDSNELHSSADEADADDMTCAVSEITKGNFVVVNYKLFGPSSSMKQYVGKIIEQLPDTASDDEEQRDDPKERGIRYEVAFMRYSGVRSSNTFVFPVIEDVAVVDHVQILRKLPSPTRSRRGQYVFPCVMYRYGFE